MDFYTATEQAYKNGYEQGQKDANANLQAAHNKGVRAGFAMREFKNFTRGKREAAKEIAETLIDFIRYETFRKGYELKKVERKVRGIAKAYGVKIADGE